MTKETCPNCGSEHVERDEVDIGVGTMYGPLGCYDCGWSEPRYYAEDEPATLDEPLAQAIREHATGEPEES